jgi:hypothetical protein
MGDYIDLTAGTWLIRFYYVIPCGAGVTDVSAKIYTLSPGTTLSTELANLGIFITAGANNRDEFNYQFPYQTSSSVRLGAAFSVGGTTNIGRDATSGSYGAGIMAVRIA